MTAATLLRPTRAGIVKFGLLYAAFISIPISITWLVLEGPSVGVIAGLAAGYLVAALAFAALVGTGFYGFTPTEAGLRSGRHRARVLPWSQVDRIETGRFLGWEIWIRVLGKPEAGTKAPVLAVFPAFVYGMSPAELRDLLITYLSRRTESPI